MVKKHQKGQLSDSEELIWMVLSFFALNADKQAKKVGPSENWFCKENKKNKGANYLKGLSVSYIEYWGFISCQLEDSNLTVLKGIYDRLVKMFLNEKCWSIDALSEDDNWLYLRIQAKEALNILGLPVHSLKEFIWFPEFIHMEHYSDRLGNKW